MLFRPWGELSWLLYKLQIDKFDLFGCIATESRSSGTYSSLVKHNKLSNSKFLEIIDPTNSSTHDNLREAVKKAINSKRPPTIEQHTLLEPTAKIVESCNDFLANSTGNTILDISTFPKRFLFPITKLFVKDDRIKNLVITYTIPEKYSEGNLSDNAQSWAPLPLFSADDVDGENFDIAIIGIGFMPLGLPNLLKDKQDRLDVKLLFPFPPGPPYYQRTWDFVNQMDASSKIDTKQIYRIDAKAVPSIFDKITSLSDNKVVLFAPYGPKTMSLAMCLYAISRNSSVYYTQPTSYNPYYSEGIGSTFAYLVKFGGKSLYL